MAAPSRRRESQPAFPTGELASVTRRRATSVEGFGAFQAELGAEKVHMLQVEYERLLQELDDLEQVLPAHVSPSANPAVREGDVAGGSTAAGLAAEGKADLPLPGTPPGRPRHAAAGGAVDAAWKEKWTSLSTSLEELAATALEAGCDKGSDYAGAMEVFDDTTQAIDRMARFGRQHGIKLRVPSPGRSRRQSAVGSDSKPRPPSYDGYSASSSRPCWCLETVVERVVAGATIFLCDAVGSCFKVFKLLAFGPESRRRAPSSTA